MRDVYNLIFATFTMGIVSLTYGFMGIGNATSIFFQGEIKDVISGELFKTSQRKRARADGPVRYHYKSMWAAKEVSLISLQPLEAGSTVTCLRYESSPCYKVENKADVFDYWAGANKTSIIIGFVSILLSLLSYIFRGRLLAMKNKQNT